MQNENKQENPIIVISEENWPLNTLQMVDLHTILYVFIFTCLFMLIFIAFYIYVETSYSNILPFI